MTSIRKAIFSSLKTLLVAVFFVTHGYGFICSNHAHLGGGRVVNLASTTTQGAVQSLFISHPASRHSFVCPSDRLLLRASAITFAGIIAPIDADHDGDEDLLVSDLFFRFLLTTWINDGNGLFSRGDLLIRRIDAMGDSGQYSNQRETKNRDLLPEPEYTAAPCRANGDLQLKPSGNIPGAIPIQNSQPNILAYGSRSPPQPFNPQTGQVL